MHILLPRFSHPFIQRSPRSVRCAAILFCLALLHASAASAQDADRVSFKVSPDALRAHVEYLADDLLEGRGTGSRGHALAAAYVAAQFKQLGMKPAGDDGKARTR
jgi:hypothetical protein